MGAMELPLLILLLFSAFLVAADAEIYIVTVEGDPVVSYTGGIDGFEATAVDSDKKIDSNRYDDTSLCFPVW